MKNDYSQKNDDELRVQLRALIQDNKTFEFESNEQLKLELRSILRKENISLRKVASTLDISPQLLNKNMSKKNFTLEDMQDILGVAGYKIYVTLIKEDKQQQ